MPLQYTHSCSKHYLITKRNMEHNENLSHSARWQQLWRHTIYPYWRSRPQITTCCSPRWKSVLPTPGMHFSFMYGHQSAGHSHIQFSVNTSLPCATMDLVIRTTSRKVAIKHTIARADGEVTRVDLSLVWFVGVLGGKGNCFGRYTNLKKIFCNYSL